MVIILEDGYDFVPIITISAQMKMNARIINTTVT